MVPTSIYAPSAAASEQPIPAERGHAVFKLGDSGNQSVY
jgi:hypothetical protein